MDIQKIKSNLRARKSGIGNPPEWRVQTLRAEIGGFLSALARIEAYAIDFQNRKLNSSGDVFDAMAATHLLSSYYNCIETIFLRILEFFENDIEENGGRQDLLSKMTLNIEGVRQNVISENVYPGLLALLGFRDRARDHYQTHPDWDKLKFLFGKFDEIHIQIKIDLTDFDHFLQALASP